jgi:Family of unknown function (DUF6279)
MTRLARVAAACCLALWLTGCGMSLLYPRLDSVVAYYIEDLVTLDPAQSSQLERTLAANLAWHRDSELRRYADFLRGLAGSIESGPDDAAWRQAGRQTEQYWRGIFSQAAPGYTAVAATLTDAQVAELLANLERRDEERWREFAGRTPEKQQAQREKSMRRSVERFTGTLTPEQRSRVHDYASRAESFMPEWRENRRIWRQALAAALADRHSGERFATRMYQLIAEPDSLWTAQYRAAIERRRSEIVQLLADLDGSLTPRHRGAAQREMLALADELQQLAGRRG